MTLRFTLCNIQFSNLNLYSSQDSSQNSVLQALEAQKKQFEIQMQRQQELFQQQQRDLQQQLLLQTTQTNQINQAKEAQQAQKEAEQKSKSDEAERMKKVEKVRLLEERQQREQLKLQNEEVERMKRVRQQEQYQVEEDLKQAQYLAKKALHNPSVKEDRRHQNQQNKKRKSNEGLALPVGSKVSHHSASPASSMTEPARNDFSMGLPIAAPRANMFVPHSNVPQNKQVRPLDWGGVKDEARVEAQVRFRVRVLVFSLTLTLTLTYNDDPP
jgi:hypothetical protein